MQFNAKPSRDVADIVVVMSDGSTHKVSECWVDVYVDEPKNENSPGLKLTIKPKLGGDRVYVLSGWVKEEAPAVATHRTESFESAQAIIDGLTKDKAAPSSAEFSDDEIPF